MWFAHGFPCPVEDQEDVVESMRLDAVDEMTEQLQGTGVGGVAFGDDERPGCGGTVPPCFAENSSSCGLLERVAEDVQKARMSFIEAHASKPVLQGR